MGRPPKNASHVLVRLRKQISTPTGAVTRKTLAARIGLSTSTIREIENGGFKLTPEVAQRIMVKTGVSMESLLKNEDPLKDISGQILKASSAKEWMSDLYYQHEINLVAMMAAAIRAAKEKRSARIFYELFKEWLPQAVDSIGATEAMRDVLNRNLGAFDPYPVFEPFKPTDAKTKARWDAVRTRLIKSAVEKGGLNPDGYAQAYQEILNSGELRETVPEAAKPVFGKRSHLAPRPEA